MLNFLPQKNRKQIISEYLLRVGIFFLLFIFLASLVLTSLFIPSVFFVKYKNDTVNEQLESIKSKTVTEKDDPVAFIKSINMLLAGFSESSTSTTHYSLIVDKIISLKNSDIRILSINVAENGSPSLVKISINGIAKTRDALSAYEKDMKIDAFFESVIFPVASFIKSFNSEFSATLTYKNK